MHFPLKCFLVFRLPGCNLTCTVDLFTDLHELASACAHTVLKPPITEKPPWGSVIKAIIIIIIKARIIRCVHKQA